MAAHSIDPWKREWFDVERLLISVQSPSWIVAGDESQWWIQARGRLPSLAADAHAGSVTMLADEQLPHDGIETLERFLRIDQRLVGVGWHPGSRQH